jgi:GNAT superfamily N-acetyltransferase
MTSLISDFEITESNRQFIAAAAFISRYRPGADIVERDGLAIRWSGAPGIFFNTVFLTERIADAAVLKRRFQTAAQYMRAKPQRGLFLACKDYLSGDALAQLDAVRDEAGLVFAADVFGMTGDYQQFEHVAEHPGLRFERAVGDEGLRQCADISSAVNGDAPEARRESILGSRLWKEQAFSYLAYHQGKAVSTATAIVNEGQLYLALVATLPDMQRRGFGEATVRHALKATHEATGLSRTSLDSTPAAVAVYERIGYRRVTRTGAYLLSGAL